MIEGSGSGRPKNMWIRIRMQICNTGTYIFFPKWSKLCTAHLMGTNFIKKKFKIIIVDPFFGSKIWFFCRLTLFPGGIYSVWSPTPSRQAFQLSKYCHKYVTCTAHTCTYLSIVVCEPPPPPPKARCSYVWYDLSNHTAPFTPPPPNITCSKTLFLVCVV